MQYLFNDEFGERIGIDWLTSPFSQTGRQGIWVKKMFKMMPWAHVDGIPESNNRLNVDAYVKLLDSDYKANVGV